MLQATYDWMMDKAVHRHAVWWLAAISFIESSFFPIPPDIMLIPMVLAAPTQWFRLALVCTLASVAGGFLGYAIGFYLMDSVGMTILNALGAVNAFNGLKPVVDKWGVWFIIAKGMTPFPYKVVTIAAGAFQFNLGEFTVASVVARGMRFFMIAALLWKFGPPIRIFVEKRLKLVLTGALVLVVAGFAMLKLF